MGPRNLFLDAKFRHGIGSGSLGGPETSFAGDANNQAFKRME